MLIASTFETFPDISEKSSYPPKKQAVKLRSEMLIGINATLKLLHTCFFIAYSTCICQAKWRFANLLQRRHNDEGWIMPDSLHINPECRAKQENSHGLTGFFFFFLPQLSLTVLIPGHLTGELQIMFRWLHHRWDQTEGSSFSKQKWAPYQHASAS